MTTPQTVINQDITPTERPRLTVDDVRAQWLQNAGGGIGAACVVGLLAVGGVIWAGLSWQMAVVTVAAVSCGASVLVFGALMFIRSIIDEWMDGQSYRDMCADIAAYEADLQTAEQQVTRLAARVKELERELAGAKEAARGKNFTPAEPEASSPLADDVREMIRVRYAIGRHPSRRYMQETLEWSQPRHERAMSELRRARIITGDSANPTWPDTMGEAIDLLAKAA